MIEVYLAPLKKGTLTITAGSNAVTGDDTLFTSADVGADITIRTAIGDLHFLIGTVVSGTSITLLGNAPLSQVGCYYSQNFTPLDVDTDLAFPITYSISDIQDISSRSGTGSKSISFPGTKTNCQVFDYIFEINNDGSFNPNIKCSLIAYVDKTEVARGVFKLDDIIVLNDQITFEGTFAGGFRNLYTQMADFLLTDLDLSSLDHTFDFATQAASWSAPYGSSIDPVTANIGHGYVYLMVDRGNNNLDHWDVDTMYPAVYVKEYIDRIFRFCGATYSSTFFNSELFRRLVVPFNRGRMSLTDVEVASREFQVSLQSGTFSSGSPGAYYKIPFDRSTSPDFDPSGQYNTSTHEWTVAKAGVYVICCNYHYNTFSTPGTCSIAVFKNGNLIAQDGVYPMIGGPTSQATLQTRNVRLAVGDTIDIRITGRGGTLHILNDTTFYNRPIAQTAENDQVLMNFAIPDNIKLSDFFMSVVKMFNLFIDEDKITPNKYIIEPRNTPDNTGFYDNQPQIDWTGKWDTSQPVKITPMALLTNKNYLFSYNADSDFWNARYSSEFYTQDHNDIYGERFWTVDNDFQTDTNKTEIIFAPTPLVLYPTMPKNPSNTKILPTIHFSSGNDTDAIDRADANNNFTIRILYYGGLLPGTWTSFQNGTTYAPQTQYPYAGHLDNPYSPTLDINFGTPGKLFYKLNSLQYTDSNLFNNYYYQYISEITDKESKVIELYVKLSPADILQLDFRKQILIDKTYYKLLEITDYDINTEKPVLVKLLRSKFITIKPSINYKVHGGKGGVTGTKSFPELATGGTGTVNANGFQNAGGSGNEMSPTSNNIIVTGDNNIVYGKSDTVHVVGGSGNTVLGNNVTLINCTNQDIIDDDVVYINNVKYVPGAADLSSQSGTAVLVGGSVMVPYSGLTTSAIVSVTPTDAGTLTGILRVAVSTGSFTIGSFNITTGTLITSDTATVNWFVVSL